MDSSGFRVIHKPFEVLALNGLKLFVVEFNYSTKGQDTWSLTIKKWESAFYAPIVVYLSHGISIRRVDKAGTIFYFS